jgi:RNA polymerase sigma factor (sigma-70 family)
MRRDEQEHREMSTLSQTAELDTAPGESPLRETEDSRARRIRRVVIEEDQRRKIEHAALRGGYADDVSPDSHGQETFRLINERKELDALPEAEHVIPMLDNWKYWTKMNDWDSRNSLLEDLIAKLRRHEASPAELQLLVIVCGPAWRAVRRSLRRYGGVDIDPRAEGRFRREEAKRVNELDREELDQVVRHGLLDALYGCPRPLPRRFFPWLKNALAHRALDHVRGEIAQHESRLPGDAEIAAFLDRKLAERTDQGAVGHAQWVHTMDLPSIFEVAEEYSSYARVRGACEQAVNRLPKRQRQVIQQHYFERMTQTAIAEAYNIAPSTIRNTHRDGLRNLRRDDDLFEVLEAVGQVRDRERRLKLQPAA